MHRINITVTLIATGLAILGWLILFTRTYPLLIVKGSSLYSEYQLASAVLTGVACIGWGLTNWSYQRGDHETRCRKCRHILRGLSEPRCPECGQAI